jgi:hypothetical protein
MEPGRADIPISGKASDHDTAADRVESFARPCLLAGHWLQADPSGEDGELSRESVSAWFREGLLAGTDPDSPHYWGPTANYHQHTVEMAALVLSLEMARPWLWDPFSSDEKAQIAEWLGSVRGVSLHANNHMFFCVLPTEFLRGEGYELPTDGAVVDRLLDHLESMHLGGGWFVDGMNEAVDYYNAFGFHYWGLWWSLLYGQRNPSRAGRWLDWADPFLQDYAHFFAVSGEHPPFGRSMHYRFAASAPFAVAIKAGVKSVQPGLARRVCTRNLAFFLQHPIGQAEGCLSAGWINDFRTMAEPYCCPGSPYWAAKAFAPLLLPPDHEFWTAPEQPMPSERGDFSRAIAPATFVIRSTGGDVELLNAGTWVNASNRRFGTAKYGKFSVRTGVGQLTQTEHSVYPPDCALTARLTDGTVFGRHTTHAVEVSDDHLMCLFSLGEKTNQQNVQVESFIGWNGGWQIHVHRYVAREPVTLSLGSYALAGTRPEDLRITEGDKITGVVNPTHSIAVQSLIGFDRTRVSKTPEPDGERLHIYATHSVTLILESAVEPGQGVLAGLTWVGAPDAKIEPWTKIKVCGECLTLENNARETWTVRHRALSNVDLES